MEELASRHDHVGARRLRPSGLAIGASGHLDTVSDDVAVVGRVTAAFGRSEDVVSISIESTFMGTVPAATSRHP